MLLAAGFLGAGITLLPANQLSPTAEPVAALLPPLPEGPEATGGADVKSIEQATLARMVQDLALANGKPKLAVLEALVTIDGVVRPDLGASFSDTLTAKFLTAGHYDVVDASALSGSNGVALSALDFGKATGADFVVAPTVVGIQGEFRLTIRKLRLPGGRIDKIVQETARGDQRLIYGLAEKSAAQLAPAPDPNAPPKKYEPPFTYVRAWMAPPVPVDPVLAAVKKAPKALKGNGSLAGPVAEKKAAQAFTENGIPRTPQRLGEIVQVDFQWCFCEFPATAGTVKLKDSLFAWSGNSNDTPISLTVSRVEGSRVIADFDAADPRKNSLHTGLSVYQWKPLK